MKLKNFKYLSLILVLIAGVFFYNDYTKVDYDQVRLKHSEFLKNSPFVPVTKNYYRIGKLFLTYTVWSILD